MEIRNSKDGQEDRKNPLCGEFEIVPYEVFVILDKEENDAVTNGNADTEGEIVQNSIEDTNPAENLTPALKKTAILMYDCNIVEYDINAVAEKEERRAEYRRKLILSLLEIVPPALELLSKIFDFLTKIIK